MAEPAGTVRHRYGHTDADIAASFGTAAASPSAPPDGMTIPQW